MITFNKFLIMPIFSFSLLISGCASNWLDDAGIRNETIYPPAYPVDNPAPAKTGGSIYQAGHEISLYQDHTPGRIGDILTVKLEEATQGEKKAKTKTNKSSSGSTQLPLIDHGIVRNQDTVFATDLTFDGDGESNQQNKLRGTITVTVTRVLSNGNLVVQGESWLTINQGREYIRLSGIVRREDIDANNVISSQRLADARIAYSGNGQVADSSRGGIITQLLFKFFPY